MSPEIQNIPPPPSAYTQALQEIRRKQTEAVLTGKTFVVERQRTLQVDDLVVWDPTGQPGLWRITHLNYWDKRDGEGMDAMIGEATSGHWLDRHDIPRGKVRLEWEGGWGGYCGRRMPVVVKLSEIRLANEMEALGIAASS